MFSFFFHFIGIVCLEIEKNKIPFPSLYLFLLSENILSISPRLVPTGWPAASSSSESMRRRISSSSSRVGTELISCNSNNATHFSLIYLIVGPVQPISCTDPPFLAYRHGYLLLWTCKKGGLVQEFCCTGLTCNCTCTAQLAKSMEFGQLIDYMVNSHKYLLFFFYPEIFLYSESFINHHSSIFSSNHRSQDLQC